MTLSLIACVCLYKNKLAIGSNEKLLFKIKQDQQFFKNITTNSLCELNIKNIVLMGRKTYESIPGGGGLKNRINFVLTNNKNYIVNLPKYEELSDKCTYFINMKMFDDFYNNNKKVNVFVIGGQNIYNIFLKNKLLTKLYITHVENNDNTIIKFDNENKPDTFIDNFSYEFKLVSYSEKYISNNKVYKARVLYYIRNKNFDTNQGEFQYLNLMKNILNNGNQRLDRTQTGTVSLFGTNMRFDISSSIPLLTTKKIPFKTIVSELLWILQGNTDAKILQKQGIHIWDGNTSREFLDNQNLQHYPEGVLGAGYGFQLRHHGAKYSSLFADKTKMTFNDRNKIGGFDQLQYIEHLLKTDPFSRRIMFSYWNPSDFNKTALQPCHINVQFYVTEENKQKYLSCQFMMRSNDFDTAACYNITSYTILTYILAKRCNMLPKEMIYTCGDCHIYKNHLEQVQLQLTRIPRPFPDVILNNSLIYKDWQDMSVDDFELIGYFPHNYIKIEMAI